MTKRKAKRGRVLYGSLCTGLAADAVAWHPLGWEPAFFAEIDPYCCALLEEKYPGVPNLGDITDPGFCKRARKVLGRRRLDILAAGTPCQPFSFAGLGKSLEDDRGNLTLRFVEIVHELKPVGVVWENVPGILSKPDNPFGCMLGGLVGAGEPLFPCHLSNRRGAKLWWKKGAWEKSYPRWPNAGMVVGPKRSAAWRVLDAQHFGVAQRRRRPFVVSFNIGSRVNPGAILFEPEVLPRHHPPRKAKGKKPAAGGDARASGSWFWKEVVAVLADSETLRAEEAAVYGGNDTSGAREVAAGLNAKGGSGRQDFKTENFVVDEVAYPLLGKANMSHDESQDNIVAMQCQGSNVGEMGELRRGNANETGGVPFVAAPLKAEGFDASEDGTGRGTPIVPVAATLRGGGSTPGSHGKQSGADRATLVPVAMQPNQDPDVTEDGSPPVTSSKAGTPVVAFGSKDADPRFSEGIAPTLRAGHHDKSHPNAGVPPAVAFDPTQLTHPENRSNPQPGDPAPSMSETGQPAQVTRRMRIRRLTPRECERLQGFKDDYTLIDGYRARAGSMQLSERDIEEMAQYLGITTEEVRERGFTPDGPRYRSLGNAWATVVPAWIGQRINLVLSEGDIL